MAITVAQQLGFYEITALPGDGGMGEVYRAKDNKLKRDVAIKILPEEFSHDDDRVTRFQREPKFWHHSIIRTSRQSTILRKLTVHVSLFLSLKARRSRTAFNAALFRL